MSFQLKKNISALLCAALLTACLSGCGGTDEAAQEETPAEQTVGEVITDAGDGRFTLNCDRNYAFNPLTTPNSANRMVSELMYDTIYELSTEFTAEPKLVTACKTEDGVHWSFTVDTSVKFWDGTTLTAYDAAESIRLAMRSSVYKTRLSSIIGLSAMDAETVAVTLAVANMRFPNLLNIPVIKDGQGDYAVPQGTGPYEPNDDMTELTAFKGYRFYSALPIEKIYLTTAGATEELMNAFDNSEIDLTLNDPNSSASLGFGSSNESRYYNTTNMNYIGFNCRRKFFSNALCRRAMTYIIDREKIVSESMGGAGLAATLPVSPAAGIYNNSYSEMMSYSQKKAEAALEEAEVQDYDDDGFRERMETGIPMEIDLVFVVCADSPGKVAAARMIADSLASLDIKVELRELGWDEYQYAVASGDCDMYYAEVRLTGDFNIRQLVFSTGTLNYGGYSDSAMEDHVNAYLAAGEDELQNAADLMYKYVTDSAPFVTVCFEKRQVVTHRGVVTGIKPTQYNIFHDIGDWTISFE